MKNSTIRLVIILATLSTLGIAITQLYWVKRAFDLKQDEFNRTVNNALYNVAQQIYEIKDIPAPSINPVKQLSTNYFVVMVNSEINAKLLEFLLQTEFEKRNLIVDFEYGIYDCTNDKIVYGNYVPLKSKKENVRNNLPLWANKAYYFGVQFPNREAHIINQMGIWLFSSIVLLVVIIFFAYTIFIILKQRRLSEIQKDFINNMTHEFKTPISTIALSTEVLKDPAIIHQPERLLQYTTIIEKENLRLKQQVERVLQMAQLDIKDIVLKKEHVNLCDLVQEAINHSSVVLQGRQCDVVNIIDKDLQEIKVDRLHLINALSNLLENAIKYCINAPAVKIQSSPLRNGVLIEVLDNGIGISSENQKHIFQKFYRVPSGNVHDVKGFGLGLSYVKTVIEAHGGHVGVKSEVGKGSIFSMFLPSS